MKWLIVFIFLFTIVQAEEITTDNLVTNGNFETGNANGWTTSGDVQVLNDCCELNGVSSNYDLEFGDSGSINQNFNLSSDTITQNMLDNGITLDSSIDAQNGECGVAGCWGGQGNADTFTNVLTIKDSDGNVLASTTTIRTDTTGINGAIFTDRLIYNGTGSNVGNINISGTDANAPSNLGGPNIDNVSVTMTYDTSVISAIIEEEIVDIFENVEELFEELITFFEEPVLEMEVVEVAEEFEEVAFEPVLMMVEEMPMEEEIMEEEVMEEIAMEEEAMIEEEMMEEETVKEAPSMLEVKNEEESKEPEEKESVSEGPATSIVQKQNNTKQKKVQSKEAVKPKLEKVMAKIDEKVKNPVKNLQLKNILKLDAMTNQQVSLDAYNVPFYEPKNIYLDQLNIFDNRQIYPNKSLATYIQNDKIDIKARKLQEINSRKQQILLELEVLQNG
jgi:hypothetical protein